MRLQKGTLRLVKPSGNITIVMILTTLFVISLLTAGIALRQNSLKVLELRTSLEAADKSGKGVEEALKTLQDHVTRHMNTPLTGENGIHPAIRLSSTYERAVLTEHDRVSSYNAKINIDAQNNCEKRYGAGQVQNRLACIAEYNVQNGIKEQGIAPEFYSFDFASPKWSPDLAGWSIVVTFIFGISSAIAIVMGRLVSRHE